MRCEGISQNHEDSLFTLWKGTGETGREVWGTVPCGDDEALPEAAASGVGEAAVAVIRFEECERTKAMPLKKSDGNMYPWVTHTHSHLTGKCPHGCVYCYVQAMAKKFANMKARYGGALGFDEKELKVVYGSGRTIFVEHMNDLFAEEIPRTFISAVLLHCWQYPGNQYAFQTKNPARYLAYLHAQGFGMPALPLGSFLGTTIESNRDLGALVMGYAPPPLMRKRAMVALRGVYGHHLRFVTIEPILDFDVNVMVDWLWEINPDFVNIGADSKGHGLPEPSADKVWALIASLGQLGIEIREKHNLARLLGE